MLFPVASDLAILSVDNIWKKVNLHSIDVSKFGVMQSILLSNHFSLPTPKYINQKLIKTERDIQKYKSKNDQYTYKIHELDEFETIFINNLLMNEAYRYVGYKTKDEIMSSVMAYVMKQEMDVENVKNDFSFVLDERSKLY